MVKWVRRLALALGVSVCACGNGVVIISVNSGVIVGAPVCQGSGGQFQLRNQGGLVVLVVITDNTRIVIAGGTGSCADLSPDTAVEVSGHQNGDHVVANSVTVE
jgi:hypothetical protein